MAEDDGFAGLAPAYRDALALEAQGATAAEMAERLDVPIEAIRSLLRLAHAKAEALAEGGHYPDDAQPHGC